MMFLALDTAMASCSVAVLKRGAPHALAAAFRPMDKGHAEALAPMVQQVMAEAGVRFADLSRIAVTVGPGTFTGVRIGLAFARGLGVALSVPVIGLDTLSAIAANEDGASTRLVVADARKDEVYAALIGAGGTLLRKPAVIARESAAMDVPAETLVLGTAADAVLASAPQLVRSRVGDLPVAAHFGPAAFAAEPSAMPSPLYLRAADAKPQQGYAVRQTQRGIFQVGTEASALLAQMHGECFDNPWDAKALADLIGAPGAMTLVAQDGGEPVGFILTRRAADEAEIITIATRPFAQRTGVASALLTESFTHLQKSGVERLFLEVASTNRAARALYTAHGFAEAGLRTGYYDRGRGAREDAVVMRKTLP